MIHSRKEISPAALLAVLLLVTGCASHGPSVRSEAEAPTDSIAENLCQGVYKCEVNDANNCGSPVLPSKSFWVMTYPEIILLASRTYS